MRYLDTRALSIEAVDAHLRTESLGRTIVHSLETASTNEDAKAAGKDRPHGTLFVSEIQTGGKGRMGRRWSSPPGGIFMSLLLRPTKASPSLPALSIAAGYCVAAAVREDLGLPAMLKWPNDVLVDGKKICGILCESSLTPGVSTGSAPWDSPAAMVVVGIGINANLDTSLLPPEVQETASSLSSLAGHQVDRETLIAGVLNRLEPAYRSFMDNGLEGIVKGLNDIAALKGQQVTVARATSSDISSTHGFFRGIDVQGRAIIEVPGGETVLISAGDLSLRSC